MGFLGFIAILFLGFYLLGAVGRLFLGWFVRRSERRFREYYGSFGSQGRTSGAKEGDIRVVDLGTNPKKVSSHVGEYIEFEETEEIKIETE